MEEDRSSQIIFQIQLQSSYTQLPTTINHAIFRAKVRNTRWQKPIKCRVEQMRVSDWISRTVSAARNVT